MCVSVYMYEYLSIEGARVSTAGSRGDFNREKDVLGRREGLKTAGYTYHELPFRRAPMQCEFQVRASNCCAASMR